MKTKIILAIVTFLVVFFSACSEDPQKKILEQAKDLQTMHRQLNALETGHQLVVYFDFSYNESFLTIINEFCKEHPDCKIVAMTGTTKGAHGWAVGYIVTWEKVK